MIKNNMLYYLLIFLVCLIVANITSAIYASVMIFSGVGLGIFVIFIGLAVGRSAYAFTNLFSAENNELTISEDNYTTRLSVSAFISAFLSIYGVILGDVLTIVAYYDTETDQFVDYVSTGFFEIFIYPFIYFFNSIDLAWMIELLGAVFKGYFTSLSSDPAFGIMSILFLGIAVYFGYNSAWGTRYSWF